MANQAGFTMVELMVVIAIVLLLLLIAVPSFADLIDRARVRGAAGAAISVLSEARGGSVQTNRDVVVNFAGTNPAWCIGAVKAAEPAVGDAFDPTLDAACDCSGAPTGCTVNNQQLTVLSGDYNGVTMGARPANFIYDGRLGVLQDFSTLPSVTFTSPKGKYQIQVNVAALGQASLCIPSGQPVIQGISSC
jgi:type IV fimbrial biogenesis protein FimT